MRPDRYDILRCFELDGQITPIVGGIDDGNSSNPNGLKIPTISNLWIEGKSYACEIAEISTDFLIIEFFQVLAAGTIIVCPLT
jgi:hypothetical protein